MKKLFYLFIAATMFTSAFAQNADNKWSLGLMVGKTAYIGDLGSGVFDFSPFYGLTAASLNRYLNSSFDIGIQGEYGDIGFWEFENGDNFLSTKLDGSLMLKFKFYNGYMIKEDALFSPFLTAGVGAAKFTGTRPEVDNTDMIFPMGGGVKLNLAPRLALQYQILFNFTTGDDNDGMAADINDYFMSNTFGLVFSFGSPKDSDKDGVPDKTDNCPGTPEGVSVTADGCPVDGDKDGIADYLDKCPAVAGIAEFGGCPDTDGDGIQDSEDDCPNVKGLASFRGCPDADGDGVKDSEDRCPTVKGLVAFNGCPDTDDDGIIDSEDRCPNHKGTIAMKGCPDGDNDGIADIDDKCPTVFGIIENKGCPAVKAEAIKVFEKALRGINFETGKDVIKSSSFAILNDVVKVMEENPEYNLEINGHTDAVGSDEMNLDLSKRRSASVKKYLTDKGIDASRMTTNGFGETMPVGDNSTSDGRYENRRVEFKVVF